jgi:5'(3')-deoxyribonucleotidase
MKIAIDMDGTIANWTNAAINKAKQLFNIVINKEDIKNCKFADIVKEMYLINTNKELEIDDDEIYNLICTDNFYLDLNPIEEAINAVKQIKADGHSIVFLTKPTDWYRSSDQKFKWLQKYFSDIEYDVVMVSSMEGKHIANVHVIVDDDPRALANHPTAIPVCVAQPWNKEFRESGTIGMVVINKLSELPTQIKFINDLLEREEELLQ